MAFFNSAVGVLQTLVIALGAGLGIWALSTCSKATATITPVPSPRASFVLPAKAVHENQYGKGLWAKIPADGTTVVTKPTLQGQDEAGKNIWQDVKTQVPNRDLKSMLEAYKIREPQTKETQHRASARDELNALVKDTAAKVSITKHFLETVLIQDFDGFPYIPDDSFFFQPLKLPVKRWP